jgi:hypothetical protein
MQSNSLTTLLETWNTYAEKGIPMFEKLGAMNVKLNIAILITMIKGVWFGKEKNRINVFAVIQYFFPVGNIIQWVGTWYIMFLLIM